MNINYVKNIFDKYKNEEFSGLLEQREKKASTRTLPMAILFSLLIANLFKSAFNIPEIMSNNDYFNPLLFLFVFLTLYITKEIYFFIKGVKLFKFDINIQENYKELYEVYKELFEAKYSIDIANDNPFIYFLLNFKDINDEEINQHIESKKLIQQINKD